MNINPENPVNILIYNFDEEQGNEYNDLNNFIEYINNKNPNIIFICTQNSKSRTDKHLQHLIYHINKKTKQIVSKLPSKYRLFSKIDATRQSNLKKIYYTNLKNVRTRIYYNTDTVFVDNAFNRFSKQSSKKRSIFNFTNNNIDENNETYNQNYNEKKIIIKKYKYKRYTDTGELGRIGSGGIMSSIVFKMNNVEYQYIVCNYFFLKEQNKTIQNKLNIIYKNNNINNLIVNQFTKDKKNIFIYFITDYTIKHNKIYRAKKNSFYKFIGQRKNINNLFLPKKESFIFNKESDIKVVNNKWSETTFNIKSTFNIQSLYKKIIFLYKEKILEYNQNLNIKNINSINNIPENKILQAINIAIENKAIQNKIIQNYLGISRKEFKNILIYCPICNYSFYLEKACGITRCCNTNDEETITKLRYDKEYKTHATKEDCDKLRQTYPNACLTPLLILTIDYQEHKDINICLSTLPYYF